MFYEQFEYCENCGYIFEEPTQLHCPIVGCCKDGKPVARYKQVRDAEKKKIPKKAFLSFSIEQQLRFILTSMPPHNKNQQKSTKNDNIIKLFC